MLVVTNVTAYLIYAGGTVAGWVGVAIISGLTAVLCFIAAVYYAHA